MGLLFLEAFPSLRRTYYNRFVCLSARIKLHYRKAEWVFMKSDI
jgi:hypothetical protein